MFQPRWDNLPVLSSVPFVATAAPRRKLVQKVWEAFVKDFPKHSRRTVCSGWLAWEECVHLKWYLWPSGTWACVYVILDDRILTSKRWFRETMLIVLSMVDFTFGFVLTSVCSNNHGLLLLCIAIVYCYCCYCLLLLPGAIAYCYCLLLLPIDIAYCYCLYCEHSRKMLACVRVHGDAIKDTRSKPKIWDHGSRSFVPTCNDFCQQQYCVCVQELWFLKIFKNNKWQFYTTIRNDNFAKSNAIQ